MLVLINGSASGSFYIERHPVRGSGLGNHHEIIFSSKALHVC